MTRMFTALVLVLGFGYAAAAQPVDRTASLREAQAFGNLVGTAAQCGIDQAKIQAYVDSALPRRLPATGDTAFDEQLNQAFEQAMRAAAAPPDGCSGILADISVK